MSANIEPLSFNTKPLDTSQPTTYNLGQQSSVYENPAFANDQSEENNDYEVPEQSVKQNGKGIPTDIASNNDSDTDSEEDEDDFGDDKGCLASNIATIQEALRKFWTKNKKWIKVIIICAFVAAYACYLGYAIYYEFGTDEESVRLLWMTSVVVFGVIIHLISAKWGERIQETILDPIVQFVNNHFTVCKWIFIGAVVVTIVVYIIVDVAIVRPENLTALIGLVFFVLLMFIFSYNPAKVKWRPVLWGLGLQFLFGVLVLKTTWGYDAVYWLGDQVAEFLDYTDAGSKFLFGDDFMDHFFAFKILPVVVFFSSVISVLYYLGVMQWVILKISWLMQFTMGTSAGESTNAAGNIFIGQTESPLLIRPLLPTMTRSEIHAVLTGGFATIAGSVMASYIAFGVPANHLISASVMSAPCALAISKLFYPETKKSKQTGQQVTLQKPDQHNVIEAACVGASSSISLVANIAVNLIAFIALLEFFNTTLQWMGHRVGLWPPDYPELSFQFICSYLLWIFPFAMGVDIPDCRQVATLIGTKVFINEFVAFTDLSVLIENSDKFNAYNGTWEQINDDIYLTDDDIWLRGGVMTDRSIAISTYALCGFANFSSVGMCIGALTAMAPNKRRAITAVAMRALVAGIVTSWMTACTAGLLYEGK